MFGVNLKQFMIPPLPPTMIYLGVNFTFLTEVVVLGF